MKNRENRNNTKESKIKKYKGVIIAVAFAILAVVDVTICFKQQPEKVEYTTFIEDLEEGNVETVYVSDTRNNIRYVLYNDETRGMSFEERLEYKHKKEDWRMTTNPKSDSFIEYLLKQGVNVEEYDFTPVTITLLSVGLSLVVPIGLLYLLIKTASGIQGIGKLKSENVTVKQTSDYSEKITFENVIGHDEVIEDLKSIVTLLKEPNIGKELSVKVPRGIIFSGSAGTGKTLLAKALAEECGVPFIYVNSSSLIEMYVGLGAKRIREMFRIAKEKAPCILFIDELDAIGGSRDARGNTSEDTKTVNALLQELDGFTDRDNVFVIASTNNYESLDKALTRAGRFDRNIIINPPKDWTVRLKMFNKFLDNNKLDESVNLERIAKQTVGFTGADITALINEAKLIALKESTSILTQGHFEEALDKIVFRGNRLAKQEYNEEKERVAIHESGHALVSYLLGVPIARASIIATTSGVGGAVFNESTSNQFVTGEDLDNKVKICYAGYCAEELYYGVATNGAGNDIEQATNYILMGIEQFGFNDKLGLLNMKALRDSGVIIEGETYKLAKEQARVLKNLTYSLLERNKEKLSVLAQELLTRETMSGEEIEKVLSEVK